MVYNNNKCGLEAFFFDVGHISSPFPMTASAYSQVQTVLARHMEEPTSEELRNEFLGVAVSYFCANDACLFHDAAAPGKSNSLPLTEYLFSPVLNYIFIKNLLKNFYKYLAYILMMLLIRLGSSNSRLPCRQLLSVAWIALSTTMMQGGCFKTDTLQFTHTLCWRIGDKRYLNGILSVNPRFWRGENGRITVPPILNQINAFVSFLVEIESINAAQPEVAKPRMKDLKRRAIFILFEVL